MTLREATVDDVPAIRRVAEAAWKVDYPDVLSRESIDEGVDDWYSAERIRESIIWAQSHVLVAERDGEVVGFVHAISEPDEDTGDILRLYVHPDSRNVGIGSKLLEEVCQTLFYEGAERVKAMVLEANETGNEFYRAFGFVPVGTATVHIGDDSYRETTYELGEEAELSTTNVGPRG